VYNESMFGVEGLDELVEMCHHAVVFNMALLCGFPLF